MSDAAKGTEPKRRPDYFTEVWVDADWKVAYRAASEEERREMRRRGVKIRYRHRPATDELVQEAARAHPMSAEEFLGA